MRNLVKKFISVVVLCSMVIYTVPVLGYTKDEVVYSKLYSDGNVYKTTVTSKIKNIEKSDLINDLTDLVNIENVSGDEEFTVDGNTIVWKANGNDIYYTGDSSKKLPVECKISYMLDGTSILANDIIGKDGRVKVLLEFINNEKREVNINGKNETMYIPFMVGVATILDNKNNENIEITNGKVIDNGNKSVVMGIAFPGMQESIGVSEDTFDIPNAVQISMDSKDFSMENIYCFVTPKIVGESEFDIFDKFDEIIGDVSKLKSASTQLVNGVEMLNTGVKKLNSGINEISGKLNIEISKYKNERNKLLNKTEIENKIVDLINDELQKLLPEIEKEAEKEAINVIKKYQPELEKSVAETSIKYTIEEINTKVESIKNNVKLLTEKDSEELSTAISNTVSSVLNKIENNKDLLTLKKSIEEMISTEMKKVTEKASVDSINEKISEMSKANLSTILSKDENSALNSKIAPIVKEIANGKIQTMIENKAKSKVDALVKSGLTKEQALIQAMEKAKNEITEADKTKALNDAKKQLMETMEWTSDTTLNKVKENAKSISNSIVNKANSNINLSGDELYKLLEQYKQTVINEITKSINENNLEIILKISENIKNKIVNIIKSELKNNKTYNKYKDCVKKDIQNSISNVASKTAMDLSKTYTSVITNEVAKNLIQKQLAGSLQNSEIDKELNKYSTLINNILNSVDKKISTVEAGVDELLNGTGILEDGTDQLFTGMKKFDKEGIQKLYDYANGDLKDIKVRIEKLQEIAKEYNTFTMLDKNNNGSVEFVMVIDKLSKDTIKKEEVILQKEEEKE